MRWFLMVMMLAHLNDTSAQKHVFVSIETNYGNMLVKLANETPVHRDNFIKLVRNHYFDTTLFHRVIPGFVLQGGDPDSLFTTPADTNELKRQRMLPEFHPSLFHKRGAFCMGRDDNPLYASFFSQFYIVIGGIYTDAGLDSTETIRMKGRKISAERRAVYKTIGGIPRLDDRYTVFGEVVEGMNVADAIAGVKTFKDMPLKPVTIKMRILSNAKAKMLEK